MFNVFVVCTKCGQEGIRKVTDAEFKELQDKGAFFKAHECDEQLFISAACDFCEPRPGITA